ncbi:MAG TPA: HRDC domain-containing protein [Acidimicrobiales bacterium]|nr:HRDC domain-containing protein [Acidimicrobiales bacterium]
MSEAEWVADDRRFRELCDVLAGEDRYGFDTEFHRERTYYPHLALLQVAWSGGMALVDPFTVDLTPLREVFELDVLAVAHAVDQDIEVLRLAVGTAPRRVFDTQVAAGFLGMSTPSLSRLAADVVDVTLPKADRLTDWTRRPLSDEQRSYAAADVAHLLDLHDALVDRLERLGRLSWAIDECDELLSRRASAPDPEEAWWKMRDARQLRGRSRGVAQELAAWRERTAAAADIPARFVLPDIALASIAHRPPKTAEQLGQVRGLDARYLARGRGEQILAAVEKGTALRTEDLRLPPEVAVDRSRRAAVALAAAWVAQLAEDMSIDASLLATRSELAALLGSRPSRLDRGWRARVVGRPVLELAAGNAALAFDGRGGLVVEVRSRRPITPDGAGGPPSG